ncbi:MAG: hypothetical protein FK734_19160 [Asgard group archaeon]|nr:hypothetical protein [Asgard group archaeon]
MVKISYERICYYSIFSTALIMGIVFAIVLRGTMMSLIGYLLILIGVSAFGKILIDRMIQTHQYTKGREIELYEDNIVKTNKTLETDETLVIRTQGISKY